MRALALGVASIAALSLGCVSPTTSAEMFELSPESAAHKAMQTRLFETSNSDELLSASAAALQDLGFAVDHDVVFRHIPNH